MWVQRYKQRPPEIYFLTPLVIMAGQLYFFLRYPPWKQGKKQTVWNIISFLFSISSVNIAGQLYFFLKHLLWKLFFFQQQWHLTTFCATQTPFQVNFSKDISFHFFPVSLCHFTQTFQSVYCKVQGPDFVVSPSLEFSYSLLHEKFLWPVSITFCGKWGPGPNSIAQWITMELKESEWV